jgi:D-ribulokinase
MSGYFIGVDVGTGSARAGVFDASGRMLGSAKRDIRIWREAGDVVEQSSDDIWDAVSMSVRTAVEAAAIDPGHIAGIGFDATCSLVVLGANGRPLPVGPSGDPSRNVIVWMDHRATEQADRINSLGVSVLDYVGGVISPEMETPKLLWLAHHMPSTFRDAWQFLDLADFLTWRATGSLARSVCTVTCKWTYLAHESRWDESYFRGIGLGVLADEGFRRIGVEIVPAGAPLGQGLTNEAAADFGLRPGVAVGAGLIDAHAGGIGTVGAKGAQGALETRMAYVFGTSACTMTTTRSPTFVRGVWGPYYSAMVPGLWLCEGGQSAAGAAIDVLARMHPASPEAARAAEAAGESLAGWLSRQAALRGAPEALARLVGDIHVVPEFLGNRAPFADPHARGTIQGLSLKDDLDSLIGLYLAGLAGIGHGARQILNAQAAAGIQTDLIVVSGGAARDRVVRQILADSTGTAVAVTTSREPVLLGSAMLGAVASGCHGDLESAMGEMSEIEQVFEPQARTRTWHKARFQAFEILQRADRDIRAAIQQSTLSESALRPEKS